MQQIVNLQIVGSSPAWNAINYLKNMKRDITVTFDNMSYNSENESFKSITTFEEAYKALGINCDDIDSTIEGIIESSCSNSAVAMFKLSIIRRALNLGQDLPFTKNFKNPYIYYPYNPCANKNSTLYKSKLNSGEMEIIGKITIRGTECNILGGDSCCCHANWGFYSFNDELLGCASKKIAQHFGKYFGMIITEAKYSNLEDFKIIANYYKN